MAATEVWISDGVPSDVPAGCSSNWRVPVLRLPLLGGVTVWGDPPHNRVRVVMACPNRLGLHEPLPPGEGWAEVWWWSDPLCAARSHYRDAPRVRRVTAPAPLPAGRPVTEASEGCRRAADYLVRRIRQIRGVHIPSVPHGRRFPVLLPTDPAPLLEGVAEELSVPGRPVDGWPGLMLCEVGWWQTRSRLDALVETVARMATGERPPLLGRSERVWPAEGL
ncbi:MAG: hypothetical protein OXM62_10570 [bacterium]|nr:hypothetical protein [bacterium]